MKNWRVVLVLLAIVMLLGTILTVKIMKNTPDKEMAKLKEEYEQEKKLDDYGIQLKTDNVTEFFEKSSKDVLWVVIITGIMILFYLLVGYKIYSKLGINVNILKWYVVLPILLMISVLILKSAIISLIVAVTMLIINLIITVMAYKIVELNPLLLLIGFIPYMGSIGISILSIIFMCKVADCFGKGTGFKIGLIFLPGIFLPVLAFSAE